MRKKILNACFIFVFLSLIVLISHCISIYTSLGHWFVRAGAIVTITMV